MKKIYYLLLTFAITSFSFGQDMVITGAFDGPLNGGTPKLIEVYVINDITDLSTYGFGSANNGEGTDGQELTFAGSATAGDFIYITDGGNGGEANFMTYFGIEPDYVSSSASINGDDALELFSGGVVIDTFGDINADGNGTPWEYLDGWAYRTDSTGPEGATFTDSNWIFSGANEVDDCTSNSTCTSVFPIGSYTSGSTTTPLQITTSVCATATSVRLTGPWWSWNPTGGPEAVSNNDGTWTFTFDPAPTNNMEYLLVVDGVQENLISIMANGGSCAPITDFAGYANRQWDVDSGDVTNNYGQCGTTCVAPVITLLGGDETITVGDTYIDAGATASDDEQGDISSDILTTSDVDTSVAGVYTVAYNVSDGALNAATEVTRTVIVEAALPPNESDSEQFCANGTDAAPTSIILTPDDLTVNNGANLLSVSVTSGTIGDPDYVGDWYDANLTVTGGVSDGITATGLAQMSDLDITGFTSITMTSVDLDAWADDVEMCLNLLVTWELPTVNDDEVVCANGTDAAPTTITLTPNDLTVNGGQQITAISVTSGTIGDPDYVGDWYDANLTITGGVSDGVTATGLAQISDIDITGFTSVTMTSVDLDAWADDVEMCLNLSVTYLEPSCLDPTNLAVSDITPTTASVTWTANSGESAWEYQVVESGEAPDATGDATSNNSLALTDLTDNTTYDVYVRANCGDSVSGWVMESFTTLFQAPSCGETAEYCYANGDGGGSGFASSYTVDPLELVFTSTVDTTGDYLTLTIGGETESNYDWVYVTDGAGNVILEPVSGAMEYEVVSEDGTVNVYISADSSVSCTSPSTLDGEPDTPLSFTVSCDPPPSCLDPTNLAVSDITPTTASVTWTANSGESAWEYQVVESGEAPDATGDATSNNSLALTGLIANTAYDVHVRANCDADGTSEWVTLEFTTSCEVASGAWSNDFDTNDDCWLVSNGGDPNTWVLYDDSANGGGVNSYAITYDSTLAHDDYLISPAFTVTDEATDRMSFDARNHSSSWFESIDVQIWNADISVLLETVATDVTPSTAYETFTYDLSAYEGQDIRFAFYISTTNEFRISIDNVVVDGLLGLEDVNTSSNFTYFPNPVNNVLSIKAQASIDSITVYNMLGQTVVRLTPNTTTTAVDMSGLQTGAYFVQVAINNSIETVRVIKN